MVFSVKQSPKRPEEGQAMSQCLALYHRASSRLRGDGGDPATMKAGAAKGRGRVFFVADEKSEKRSYKSNDFTNPKKSLPKISSPSLLRGGSEVGSSLQRGGASCAAGARRRQQSGGAAAAGATLDGRAAQGAEAEEKAKSDG